MSDGNLFPRLRHAEVAMFHSARPVCIAVLVSAVLVGLTGNGVAQPSEQGFVTGRATEAWNAWETALRAMIEGREADRAAIEAAFGELLALEPAPFRVALLAYHTVKHTSLGGALLLLEQDYESGRLGDNAQRVADLLATGREQMNEADDGWYFAQIGRFDVANANFRALLAADPDPVALLEFTYRMPKRRDVLIQLLDNPLLGESARAILKLLDVGELAIKADPTRIKQNIARLGGPPRGFENAVEALIDSGEYAIPFMLLTIHDPKQQELLRPIVLALPRIDRPALNPLVMSLRMKDEATKRIVIETLGRIGYGQAVPYLLQLRAHERTPPDTVAVIDAALDAIVANNPWIPRDITAAEAFYLLAEGYYNDRPSLAADKRLDTANVWYFQDVVLNNVEVPTPIFNEIMAMRSAEEALRHDPGHKRALALWLAANFRREAQVPLATTDPTRPDGYPSAAYFAQAAGAEYCLMALARAVDDGDPAVALGAIDALRRTAGRAIVVGDDQGRQPLAEALAFPDRMVRIRAALTLGYALPIEPFHNYQNLMPVLSEALMLHGGARNALVIDADDAAANALAGILREQGYEVLTDASLLAGLQKVREQLPGLDVLFLSADIQEPPLREALDALRSEFRFASTPVVLVAKAGYGDLVRELVQGDHRLAEVPSDPRTARVMRAMAEVSHAVGTEAITPEVGAVLALEAAEVLRLLAVTDNPLFDVADAEEALLATLATEDETLRLLVAEVLGYLGSERAQAAIAGLALDPNEPEEARVRMFQALAAAAKRRGALLGAEQIQRIVAIAESDPNMVIREAASEALGALSVEGEPASTIIRNQYRG